LVQSSDAAHFFHWSFLVHLGATRDSITLVMLKPGQLIRLSRFNQSCALVPNAAASPFAVSGVTARLAPISSQSAWAATNNFGKLDLAPAARLISSLMNSPGGNTSAGVLSVVPRRSPSPCQLIASKNHQAPF